MLPKPIPIPNWKVATLELDIFTLATFTNSNSNTQTPNENVPHKILILSKIANLTQLISDGTGDVISFTNCSSTAFAGLASMTADFETRPRGAVKVGPRLGLDESDATSVITPMLEGERIKALRPRAEGEDYYLISYGLQLSIR